MSEPAATLISPELLRERLDDPATLVIDATVRIVPGDSPSSYGFAAARDDYRAAHIPGAVYADLLNDLSDRDSPYPFTLPTAAQFSDAISALGIASERHVVIYSQNAPMWPTRLWWLLRYFGFDDVAILDGGLTGWRSLGETIHTGETTPYPAAFTATERRALRADIDEVQRITAGGGACLLNALPEDIFSGEVDSPYGRRGHIPTSLNVSWTKLLDRETGRFRDEAVLREAFREAGVLDRDEIVAYCGGGIASTLELFVLALLGRADARLYDGSITEWSSLGLPLETD